MAPVSFHNANVSRIHYDKHTVDWECPAWYDSASGPEDRPPVDYGGGKFAMTFEYDFLVFIGRFQPFHNGHARVVNRALELSRKVIILVGSANSPRTLRNPFTYEERSSVIKESFVDVGWRDRGSRDGHLIFSPIDDHTYDDSSWVEQVQSTVGRIVSSVHRGDNPKIGIIGCNKDHTSYYLKLFPSWGSEGVEFLDPLNSTDFRNGYFGDGLTADQWTSMPKPWMEFIKGFHNTIPYKKLLEEHKFVTDYKKQWSVAPYPPTFVTTDAVVIQSSHVLLIRRKAFPGRGMLALPGGFLNQDEKIEDAALRELREETDIDVPDSVIRGSLRGHHYYDDPNRSSRGRTITHAFLYQLEPHPKRDFQLPRVKGCDDAEEALWVPLSHISPKTLYEDHYYIIRSMIKKFSK